MSDVWEEITLDFIQKSIVGCCEGKLRDLDDFLAKFAIFWEFSLIFDEFLLVFKSNLIFFKAILQV